VNSQMENKSLNFNSEKGVIAAIAVTLIIVASVVAVVYFSNRPEASGYSTLYLLDDQNQAVNYPHLLVINDNNSINVKVVVENHMAKTQDYQLQMKIVEKTVSFPVKVPANSTYEKRLPDLEAWENQVAISINQPGEYTVVFELWSKNTDIESYGFTHNFCVLHFQVIANSS